jgi:hypothetical protein
MRAFFALLVLLAAPAAHAQLIEVGSGGALEFIQDAPAPTPSGETAPARDVAWVDVAKLIDEYRIPEKLADLKGFVTDASGTNAGFYFASGQKGTVSVYRNGRRMQRGTAETLSDFQEPTVFRMTASGDLLYVLRGTDLYLNNKRLSTGTFSFAQSPASVHEHGGLVTFPEGGSVVAYDAARDRKAILHRHAGAIRSLRREGSTVAYVVEERGFLRMYRDGRLVSARGVENPRNFALAPDGTVYFFTKSARGYALFRDSRSMVTGPGDGAFVGIDPRGRVWHVSYVRSAGGNTVRLRRGRSAANLLPGGVENVELLLGYPDDGYAVRASFGDAPEKFYLVRDGDALGESFAFDYPYGENHGFLVLDDGSVAYRAYDGQHWTAFVDSEPLSHATLKNARFLRVDRDGLTVYATK